MIVTPVDRIVIEIDNRKNPASVQMMTSRDLPWPYVASILANILSNVLITGLSKMPREAMEPERRKAADVLNQCEGVFVEGAAASALALCQKCGFSKGVHDAKG